MQLVGVTSSAQEHWQAIRQAQAGRQAERAAGTDLESRRCEDRLIVGYVASTVSGNVGVMSLAAGTLAQAGRQVQAGK